MIESAWNSYRAWANRARAMQRENRNWNMPALICVLAAAVCGAAVSAFPSGSVAGRVLSGIAAAAAVIAAALAQQMLSIKPEQKWVRARGVAEAIKSECYRYAASAGSYAVGDRDTAFRAQLAALQQPALDDELTPLPNDDSRDPRRPPDPMQAEWYLNERLRDQLAFYGGRQKKYESEVSRLRVLSLLAAVLGAVLGLAGTIAATNLLAPWIGVVTTLGAAIGTYGAMERKQYLAASYGAMHVRLTAITAAGLDLPAMVTQTEDVLAAEHAAWAKRVTETSAAVPGAPKDGAKT